MLADILRALSGSVPERLPEPDARLALAALLIRVAKSDGHYGDAERAAINNILKDQDDLSPFEVAKLHREAEELEAEAPDTVRFTRAIKTAVDYEDRVHVIEALWKVALADGVRDHEEDALIRLVAPMLGVNDRDSALARQRVENVE